MDKNPHAVEVQRAEQADRLPLPDEAQVSLAQIPETAKEGPLPLALSLGTSLMAELLEREVEEVVGPKGKQDRERTPHATATPLAS